PGAGGAAPGAPPPGPAAPAAPPNPSGAPSRSPPGAAPTPTRPAPPRSSAAARPRAGWPGSACPPGWSTRPAWSSPWPAGPMDQKDTTDEHRVLVREPRDRDRRAAAADRRPGPRHPGQPAGTAARPAPVRGDGHPPQPVPAVGGVHRRPHPDRGARHLRAHPADLRGRPVHLGLRAAVAGPGRGLAGHHGRDDRDQPAPRPDEPRPVAGGPRPGRPPPARRAPALRPLAPRHAPAVY